MAEQVIEVRTRRRGQTLVEFALTLPILLILLFGVIEFGRIFQAWVTLQNSARAAARLAATGQYDEVKYQLDLRLYDQTDPVYTGDLNSIVPCAKNTGDIVVDLAQRGTATTMTPYTGARAIEVFVGGVESLYASYYGGDDCDPGDTEDQNRRKDLARILSIYDEARLGAAGLALGPQQLPLPPVGVPGTLDASYPDFANLPWFYPWYRPLPGDHDSDALTPPQYYRQRFSDEPGWFDVMVCSSRPKLRQANEPSANNYAQRFRFPPILNQGGFGANTDPRAPVCLLREYPTAGGDLEADGWTDNAYKGSGSIDEGVSFWDAGGAGDTIAVVVTFNHPLVTPLGLAPFVPLQARRIAVNEAFRAPQPIDASYETPTAPGVNTATPTDTATYTDTPNHSPTPTDTPSPTTTASVTPSRTPSQTPVFQCSNVTVGSTINYVNRTVTFTLTNSLPYSVELRRVQLVWPSIAGYPDLSTQLFRLGTPGSVVWTGSDNPSPTDVGYIVTVGSGTPTPISGTPEYDFAVGANLLIQPGANAFLVQFANAPLVLNPSVMPQVGFNGTTFYYDDLNGTTDCATVFNVTVPTNTPGPTPTATSTPACEPDLVSVSSVIFQNLDIVRFDITNNRVLSPATVLGFGLEWSAADTRAPAMTLAQVWGLGAAPGDSSSVQMWAGPDTAADTTSGSATSGVSPIEGTWLSVITIPPGATESLFFIFSGGAGNTVAVDFGSLPQDFDGSVFYIDAPSCPTPIVTDVSTVQPTPTNTATSTTTNTPTTTLTPSRTPSRTPTQTYTPSQTPTTTLTPSRTPSRTPTITRTPSNTPTITPSRTPTITRTPSRTPTRTNTPTITATPSRTNTPTITNTPTNTPSNTPSRTPTITNTPSNTPTRTNTPTITNTPSRTPTNTPSRTPTITNTPTFTPSNTASRTPTITNTPTNTPSRTPSRTPTQTFTPSNTPTTTHTPSNTPSPTPSRTNTPTPSPTRTPTNTLPPLPTDSGAGG